MSNHLINNPVPHTLLPILATIIPDMKVILRQSIYPLLRHCLCHHQPWFHIMRLCFILLPVLQYCVQVCYLLPAFARVTAAALHLLLLAGVRVWLLLVLLAGCTIYGWLLVYCTLD
jgi:hypothetical protein